MESELRALADLYLEILTSRRLDMADRLFDEDFTWHFGAGLTGRGIPDWLALVEQWLNAFPDLEAIDSDTLVDAGASRFTVRMRWTATHAGAFMGAAATGRRVMNEGISAFRVEQGRVVEEWIFEDTANLMQQLSGDLTT